MPNLKLCGATRIDLKEENCTYTWTVTNLNLLHESDSKSIESPRFLFNHQKFYLRLTLYVNADPLCFNLRLDSTFDISKYKYSFTIRNEKNQKSIKSHVFGKGGEKGLWYVKRSKIYDESNKNRTIPSDTLKVICEVTLPIYTKTQVKNVTDVDFKPVSSNIFSNEYLKRFSDVNLVTSGGRVLKAHKNILAAASPIFAAMFKHDMLEKKSNKVKITDVDYLVLKEMLRFIYTGEVENIHSMPIEILIGADKYDMQGLKRKCEEYLADELTVKDVVSTLRIAAMCNAEHLKARAMNFVKSNIVKIMEAGDFQEKVQHMNPFSEAIHLIIQ